MKRKRVERRVIATYIANGPEGRPNDNHHVMLGTVRL